MLYSKHSENIIDDGIKKLPVKFSKLLSKNAKLKLYCLKKNLKLLECTTNYLDNSEYITCKSKLLNQLYEEKTNGIRIKKQM